MPKIVNHDEYKEKLVEASFELMSTRGYAALSMRDLARALRISTGTLYHYFPSKLGLFEAILQRYCMASMAKQPEFETLSESFDDGLEKMINNCRKQEELWAKILLIQVDVYREPEGKMITIFNNVFTSESTRHHLSRLLHIENDDVIDLFRALMLGIIIQRVISKKQVDWDQQKNLLRTTFKQYAV